MKDGLTIVASQREQCQVLAGEGLLLLPFSIMLLFCIPFSPHFQLLIGMLVPITVRFTGFERYEEGWITL